MRTTKTAQHAHQNHRPHGRPLARCVAATALGLTLVLASAACGGGDASSEQAGEGHNEQDVAFAQQMMVHHAQAIEMVDLTEGRDLDPQVQDLTREIEDAQEPEIDTFTQWLDTWGEDVLDTSGDNGHEMGAGDAGDTGGMSGMMTSEEMSDLETASDAEFQDMWLSMMIEHHEGAVDMAKAQIENGQYQPAVNLAETISTSQSREIHTMENLLD